VPTLTDIDLEEIHRLRSVISQLARRLNLSAPPSGLTPTQISVLGSIWLHGPLGVGELTEIEGLNPTMVSRVIGNLTAAGMIERLPDRQDRRAAHVITTREGQRVLARIRKERTRALVDGLEHMPADAAGAVLDALPALESLARQLRATSSDERS
jgi:DNA-binding MarR family transcriptional regulator